MSLQVQSILQTTPGSLKIKFAQAYATPPVVLLTSYWKGSTAAVSGILTVTNVTTTDCTITSINAASNYYVNMLAIDTNVPAIGTLKANSGSPAKTGNDLEVNYNNVLTSPDPVVLLTPFWNGSSQQVGYVDTLDDSAASECSIVSKNQAPSNFFINFAAMDLGITTTDNNQTLQNGIVNKLGTTQRVYFTKPFANPPIVMISPWWNDANQGVGLVETVTMVTNTYFEITSGNMAPNYFVNWVAVGN
ncbi:MAG: H-type lectin domain-containing protein [Bacteroidota bacterium]